MAKEIINEIEKIEKVEKLGDPVKINRGLRREFKRKAKNGEITPTGRPNNDKVKDSLDFKFKFNNVKDRVKSIYKSDKYSRRNYLWLDILYYAKMGMLKLLVPLEDFAKANSPETINRASRTLMGEVDKGMHPDLKFLLKEDIIPVRREREKEMRSMFSNDKINPGKIK